MADGLVGTWLSESYENLEAFWDALGVPEEVRQIARDKQTELTIGKEGDNWKLTTKAGDKSREMVFPPGQEVDTKSLMGHSIKATLTVEGADLVEKQQTPAGEIIFKRSLVGDNLKTTMTVKGVTAVISFKKS